MIELVAAMASLALLAAQWWLSSAPARRRNRQRRENVRIHNELAGRDVAALRRRLRCLRAQGP